MLSLDDKILDHVKSGFHIPPKPEILEKLQRIIDSESPSLEEIGSLVATDVGISSTILKTINSPFFGMARSISDVKQAVFFLGANNILNLVTVEKLKQALVGNSCISLDRFWDTANDIANAMTLIGRRVDNEVVLEDLHAIGLFHDIGIAAMSLKYDDYLDTLTEANSDLGKRLYELEDERYNTSHTVVGYYLAASWQLPKQICECILNHHDMDYLGSASKDETQKINFSILKVAENIIEKIRRFHETKDWPDISENAMEYCGFSSEDLLDIEEDLAEMLAE